MSTFLGTYISKKIEQLGKSMATPAKRVDANLPLGLKIGSSIIFNDIPMSIAKSVGAHVSAPSVSTVKGYGRSTFEDLVIHQFYLDDEKHNLQVIASLNGEVKEIFLFETLEEIHPNSVDDWTTWLRKDAKDVNEAAIIGFQTFELRENLKEGQTPAIYARVWPSGGAAMVNPLRQTEYLYINPDLSSVPSHIKRECMMYAREPARPADFIASEVPGEWIFVSATEVDDRAFVQIQAGIALQATDLTIS